jgi:transcriptional regulator with XRE-family HTH domain
VRLIDRLNRYLELRGISPHAFEQVCGLANGYLGKQLKGKGSVGSDILGKIANQYPELNLTWLITGRGKMTVRISKEKENESGGLELKDAEAVYHAHDKIIEVLKEQLAALSSSMPSKRRKIKKKGST